MKNLPFREARSQLVAWDPVKQQEAWRSPVLGTIGAGTLATAGGLVFQGTTKGRFVAYRATNGEQLWSMEAQTGVVAAASSFELDGEQYIAEEVGYGLARYGMSNSSRLLVFKLAARPRCRRLLRRHRRSYWILRHRLLRQSSSRGGINSSRVTARCVTSRPLRTAASPGPALLADAQLVGRLQCRGAGWAAAGERHGVLQGQSDAGGSRVEIRAYLIQRANQAKAAATPPR